MNDDFDYWNGDSPLLDNANDDFEVWNDDVPQLDGPISQGQPTPARRRAFVIAQTSS